MNEKKRRGSSLIFLLVFSLISLFFLIFFAQVTSAGCVSRPCYTALQRSDPSHPVPIPNQICADSLPPFGSRACVDPVQDAERIQDLTACCQKSEGNPEGFITSPRRIRIGRFGYARSEVQLQCAPGMVRDDGFCNPGNLLLIDTVSPIRLNKPEIQNAQAGPIYCDVNQVVCGINFDENNLINQQACCTVGAGVQVLPADPEKISFDAVPRSTIKLCGEGKAVCGLDYIIEGTPGRDELTSHASGFYCCAVQNLQIQQSQRTQIPSNELLQDQPNLRFPWIIKPEDKGRNLLCYSNEVVCCAMGSDVDQRVQNIAITKSLATSVACCEVRQCQPEPDCSVPRGDANCNNQLDRDEVSCQVQLGQDQERLQCQEKSLSLIEADGQALCCGNSGAEYFISGTEACIDQQVLRAPGRGGGLREQNVVLDFTGPMSVETDLFTLGGERTVIPLRERDARDLPLDNEYNLEFETLVDGSSDANTKLIVRVYDSSNHVEYTRLEIPSTHTYSRDPQFHDKGFRFVKDTFSISSNQRGVIVKVQKVGTGLVRIRNLKLSHLFSSYLLFDGQHMTVCDTPATRNDAEAAFMLVSNDPDMNLNLFDAPDFGVVDQRCKRVNQFYCDETGVWRENTFNQDLSLTDAPTNDQLQPFSITDIASQGCCPSGSCWTGDRCVLAGEDTSAFTKREGDEQQSLRCMRDVASGNAVWQSGIRKKDQYEDTSGFCSVDECWFNGERQDLPSPSQCVPSGERKDEEGIFCHNGAWKTRLTVLMETMLTVKDRNAVPEQYSLYCDNINNVLLDKEGKTAFWDAEVDTVFTGQEKACILEYNHATWSPNPMVNWFLNQIFAGKTRNTVLGILLKGDDSITDKIASEPGLGLQENICAGAQASEQKNRFFGCRGAEQNVFQDAKVYYNEELHAVIYSQAGPIRMEIPAGG